MKKVVWDWKRAVASYGREGAVAQTDAADRDGRIMNDEVSSSVSQGMVSRGPPFAGRPCISILEMEAC